MEDWEEGSDVESCRSSVISDIDELEANLYGIIHHEVNGEVNESSSNALSVLPVSDGEGFWRTKEDVLGIHGKEINIDGYEEGHNENEGCSGEKEKEVHLNEEREAKVEEVSPSCVTQDSPERGERYLSIEYADSRYNVGCASDNSKGNVATISSKSRKTKSKSSTPLDKEGSSPIVIDVLSSEDELEVHPVSNVSEPKKQSLEEEEEVVILEDSDSDVMIEMEKVTVRQNKRKKIPEFSDDIQINTVKSGKMRRFDEVSSPNFSNSGTQPSPPAVNTSSTPMKELDLSSICKTWTPEMIHFYEESWGGENLTLNEVFASMSDHGWHLDVTDQFSSLPGRTQDRRYFGNSKGWCTNCNRRGHTRNECQEEIRQQRCRRCGSATHSEYNCQEKLCLSCGKETKYFMKTCRSCRSCLDKGTKCSICSVKGHVSNCCPDLWRRFHATIAPGLVVRPKKVLYKSSMNLYCCNCATKGHHVFQCKKRTFSDYIPHSPKVVKYENPSSLNRENEKVAISENWDKRRIAHESKIKETPRSRRNGPEKVDSKFQNPKENGNFGISKTVDMGRTSIECNDSTSSVSTAVETSKMKKKRPKKEKTKASGEQDASLNGLKTPSAKLPAVRNEIGSSKNIIQVKPTKNCMDPSKKSSKMILTKKVYQMLKSREGEEVLKYVSKTEPGTAVTLLHTDIKTLMFIGSRKSVSRARNLMAHILRDKETWKEITGSVAQNGNPGSKSNDQMSTSGTEVTTLSDQPNDLRVKINANLPASRDVICLPVQAADHPPQEPMNNNLKKVKSKKKEILPEKQKEETVDHHSKSLIQTAARNLLRRSEDVTPAKVRSFSNWALRNYKKVLNRRMRFKLGALSCVKDDHASSQYLRKNLMSILKWQNG